MFVNDQGTVTGWEGIGTNMDSVPGPFPFTLTVSTPAALQNGDYLIIWGTFDGLTTVTAPSGYTTLLNTTYVNGIGGSDAVWMFAHQWATGDTRSPTITTSVGQTGGCWAFIARNKSQIYTPTLGTLVSRTGGGNIVLAAQAPSHSNDLRLFFGAGHGAFAAPTITIPTSTLTSAGHLSLLGAQPTAGGPVGAHAAASAYPLLWVMNGPWDSDVGTTTWVLAGGAQLRGAMVELILSDGGVVDSIGLDVGLNPLTGGGSGLDVGVSTATQSAVVYGSGLGGAGGGGGISVI